MNLKVKNEIGVLALRSGDEPVKEKRKSDIPSDNCNRWIQGPSGQVGVQISETKSLVSSLIKKEPRGRWVARAVNDFVGNSDAKTAVAWIDGKDFRIQDLLYNGRIFRGRATDGYTIEVRVDRRHIFPFKRKFTTAPILTTSE